ncbi:BTB/POZ domain-containing protein [Senna tora]|uniref:BTB/POZ domain-containing protein n=1 Tax=Senna tora TaxID=362788 RepID=A0A834TVB0_9FABA|nr:BTB/POZ domain-containing protein [Senna tora]
MAAAAVSPKNYSLSSSPYSSPNIGALLKIKVITWSQETGLPVSIRVRVGNKIFNLHKFPLTSKSGYFKKRLLKNNSSSSCEEEVVELPEDFPGGADTFEMIAFFIYGSSTLLIDPFNVASLRCAAQFLEMTEQHSPGNLCERFDLYLNQVVLQSWDDTIIVLHRCQSLLPRSEDLLIVSRCIESLAFMACMEVLDPEKRRMDYSPLVTLEGLANSSSHISSNAWNCEMIMEDVVQGQDLWIKDLIALPFDFFKRVITSLRRQGMKEKYVSPIIVFYANKSVLSRKKPGLATADSPVANILQGVVHLLPLGDKVVIPVGFYFALLARCVLEFGPKSDHCNEKLQQQITALLHLAQVEDLLLLVEECGMELSVSIMESVVLNYVKDGSNSVDAAERWNRVAELWDSFVCHVVADGSREMEAKRFMELIERVPSSYRQNHDQLYRAISSFLKKNPNISQEEKGAICKNLSCEKLSQEASIEAVQNDLMPLRLIVQALFVQQLTTHQAFKQCSHNSFRYHQSEDLSYSSRARKSPYTATGPETNSGPLGFLLQKDMMMMMMVQQKKSKFSPSSTSTARRDYESTSFRIQNLESEVMKLKRRLQLENINNNIVTRNKKRNNNNNNNNDNNGVGGEVGTSCISSVNLASQRKYASRLLKVFRRITWFGGASRKPKRKPGNVM